MKKFILIFILLLILISFGAFYFLTGIAKNKDNDTNTPSDTATESQFEPDTAEYLGLDLGVSVYEDYTKEKYDQALVENRVVVLYFTANWCPICRAQEPVNVETFSELTHEGVVALGVHILDSETTTELEALAKKFDVTYQHTFVVLDTKGAVFYKFTGPLEKEFIKEKAREALEVV